MPQFPPASAEALLRQALAALDTCVTALTQIDEQLGALRRETEAEHRAIREVISEIDLSTLSPALRGYLSSLAGSSFTVDHEAIYSDEVALQQELVRLRSFDDKMDYLIRLMRLARAQVQGEELDEEVAAPWEAAVRAARIEAQEEERKRLAREIHDGPAQVLANTILGLEYCEIVANRAPEELESELQRLRTMMREGLIEVRRFMFDLRPPMLASMGLITTVQRYAEDYQQAFGIMVELDLPDAELTVEDRVQMGLFRIIQESLQNVQKHAQADRVRIALDYRHDGSVQLTIADNGRGFDPAVVQPTRSSGAGLIGMTERARMLGGSLSVSSAPGTGTTVTLCLPGPSAPTHEVTEKPVKSVREQQQQHHPDDAHSSLSIEASA